MEVANNGNNSGVMIGNVNGDILYESLDSKRKLHSLLPQLIKILSDTIIKTEKTGISTIPESYDIDNKIKHNNVVKYNYLIDSYGEYYSICESSFDSLDENGFFSKERILQSISAIYDEQKQILSNKKPTMEIIKKNADQIFDNINTILKKRIRSSDTYINISEEDLDFCLPAFLCYAFAECKILENPKKAD